MTRTESNWVSALAILAVVAFFYAWSVYDSFFEMRMGYVYDPGTDRIFRIELRPSINRYDKWGPLIPFKSIYFGEVGGVEYIGKLKHALKEIEHDRRLLEEDVDAWSDKQKQKIEDN